jgi:glutathione synthase/RimK-type ligase-like ATP-grasp enzyme
MFNVPETIMTSDVAVARDFLRRYPQGAIIKTIGSPSIHLPEGRAYVYSNRITASDLPPNTSLNDSPLIVQRLIAKSVDVRVTVVGESIFATEIDSQRFEASRYDWRAAADQSGLHHPHRLPDNIARKCNRITAELGLSYSAIDLCVDDMGEYYFFEVNPNGEWAWIETEVGYPVSDAIVALLANS